MEDKMKNVCYFNSVKFWGGGEKRHLEYALEFKNHGYNAQLVTKKDSPLDKKCSKNNLPTFNINVGNLSYLNIFKYLRLIRFYKKYKIDTVVFSVSRDLKLGGIAAKIAGVERIVYSRGLAKIIKNNFINRYLFNKVITHFIANSEATKNTMLKKLGNKVDANKIKVVYNGIYFNEAKNLVYNGIKKEEGKIIIGNAGRLDTQKRQYLLVDLAEELKKRNLNFHIYIAGDGPLYKSLEEKINQKSLNEYITLLGFVSEMDAFMQSIDIFVLTSEWEGFGYVLAEAMMKGKPVVAFDISSNPEIVKDKETGFLVDFPDIIKLSDKVELLANDSSKRDEIGSNGINRARTFSMDMKFQELVEVLKSN